MPDAPAVPKVAIRSQNEAMELMIVFDVREKLPVAHRLRVTDRETGRRVLRLLYLVVHSRVNE